MNTVWQALDKALGTAPRAYGKEMAEERGAMGLGFDAVAPVVVGRMVQSGGWKGLAGQFIAPIVTYSLPAPLLERLTGRALSKRLVQLLVVILPVTTVTGLKG